MSKFKVGDRVYYTGVATHGPWAGRRTNKTPGLVVEVDLYGVDSIAVIFDDAYGRGTLSEENAELLLESDRVEFPNLIGRKPVPVNPKFVTPFKSAGGGSVEDATGRFLADVSGGATVSQDEKLAQVVAAALNAYFEEGK